LNSDKKTNDEAIAWCKNVEDMLRLFDTIPKRNRQTDRQIKTDGPLATEHSIT